MKLYLRPITMVLLGLALAGYLGFLLYGMYHSRSELQQTVRLRLQDDVRKRTAAINYFFSERLNDVKDLAENRELSTYFGNIALGMSMEYGLAASLDEANASFAHFRYKKVLDGRPIYERIVFVDGAGRKLIDTDPGSLPGQAGADGAWKAFHPVHSRKLQFSVTGKDNGSRLALVQPYYFSGRYSGYIVAWLKPAGFSHHFLDSASANRTRNILLCYDRPLLAVPADGGILNYEGVVAEAARLADGVSTTVRVDFAGLPDTKAVAVRSVIAQTPFSVISIIPVADDGGQSPEQLVVVSAVTGLLIIAGMVAFIRNSLHTRVLNTRLEETRIREQEKEEQNQLLLNANRQAEVARCIAEEAKYIAERSEGEKSKSEERLKLVLDGSNDGIWDWDVVSGNLTINRRWAEMLGYNLGELQPTTIETFNSRVHPDDLPWVYDALNRHINGETPLYVVELRMRTKDGREAWILSRGKVVETDTSGRAVRIAGTHSDITERKKSEDLLRENTMLLEAEIAERQQAEMAVVEKQEQLEELNRSLQERVEESLAELRHKDQILISQGRQAAMGEMIGNIAHQWRQPINALAMVFANIEQAYIYNELSHDYLKSKIATGNNLIQKMSTTINDFRNFFSPDKEKVPFSALEQINQSVSLVTAAFTNHNISVTIDAEGDCVLYGFPNEYSQVLLNLLSNARDAIIESGNFPGEIVISLRIFDNRGAVTVRDNGGGIPLNVLDKIFEPYFSTKQMGTGIGLYMSKMIIERNMNGSITARNIAGNAEFRVELARYTEDA